MQEIEPRVITEIMERGSNGFNGLERIYSSVKIRPIRSNTITQDIHPGRIIELDIYPTRTNVLFHFPSSMDMPNDQFNQIIIRWPGDLCGFEIHTMKTLLKKHDVVDL